MISGAHIVIFTKDAENDRAFFRDFLNFRSVDAGGGWLIFALPPAEVAFHPFDKNGPHELFFMCDNLQSEMARLAKLRIRCSEVEQAPWGEITRIPLPGGGVIQLYQPKHPKAIGASRKRRASAQRKQSRGR